MNDKIDTQTAELGIAGKFASYFIDNKLTVLVIVFALLAGIGAFMVTPREENPQIVVPAANIIVAKPGASPKEVEQLAAESTEADQTEMPAILSESTPVEEPTLAMATPADLDQELIEMLLIEAGEILDNSDSVLQTWFQE